MNTLLLSVALLTVSHPDHHAEQHFEPPAVVIMSEAPVVADIDLSGIWSGQWCSQSTGHRGPMKAQFCRINSCQYEVKFSGRFCKLIPFRYKAILCATMGEDGCVQLRGSKNLGFLFGTFNFSGNASDSSFTARYWASSDCGTFTLSRCCH